jgi:hypothetical protein
MGVAGQRVIAIVSSRPPRPFSLREQGGAQPSRREREAIPTLSIFVFIGFTTWERPNVSPTRTKPQTVL